MNNYIITYGVHEHDGFDGYDLHSTKPIPASCEEEAADIFRDAFESMEGRPCEIHSIKLINY
jgi:hypothetical protein